MENTLVRYFLATFLIFCTWLITSSFLEFIDTQILILHKELPNDIKISIFYGITTLVAILFTSTNFFNISIKKFFLFALGGAAIAMSFHVVYTRYYHWRQTFPLLININQNWSIQGDHIIITGRNFGEAWRPGEVKINDFTYKIVSWNDEKIIAEQPVIPDYFSSNIEICNYHDHCISTPFSVRDPIEVL